MRLFAASLAEMWFSARRRTRLSPDEATAELLLAKRRLGCEAPASQRTLELVLTAAAGPATQHELAGEAAAVTAFLTALAEQPERAPRRGPRRVPALATAAAFVALVALCGTAEAGALPAPLQRLAHQAINAPAPPPAIRVPRPTADVTPGSGATGSHPAPASSGPSQEPRTGKPSSSPKPTHTSASQTNGNGQPTASGSAQPSTTDSGKGNGGTPGQGGNPSGHPTGSSGQGNG